MTEPAVRAHPVALRVAAAVVAGMIWFGLTAAIHRGRHMGIAAVTGALFAALCFGLLIWVAHRQEQRRRSAETELPSAG